MNLGCSQVCVRVLGREKVSPLCHPEANVSSENVYLKIWHRGRVVQFVWSAQGRLIFLSKWTAALDDSVPGRANSCMSLFSDFPFTFNAGWSAGKCPGFTVTEVSLVPRCHPFILADVAQRLSALCFQQRLGKELGVTLAPSGGLFKSECRGLGSWGSCVCWQHSGCERDHHLDT